MILDCILAAINNPTGIMANNVLSVVLSNGTCKKCEKTVANNTVNCLICKEKFHASGCSNDADICTPSFLTSFKPYCEKVAPKYVARPGTFVFVCDPCLTNMEIQNTASNENKVDALKVKVDNLENGLKEIKSLLINSQKEVMLSKEISCSSSVSMQGAPPDVNFNAGNGQRSMNCWDNRSSSSNNTIQNMSMPIPPPQVVSKSATIILPNVLDKAVEKSQMKLINRTAVENKIGISQSYKKKNGETVIVCKSNETREKLRSHIEKVIPSIEVKTPNEFKPTVAIVGFDDEGLSKEELTHSVIAQNHFLQAFFSTVEILDHITFLNIKPLKNNSEMFQATYKVSKELRSLLKKHGDRVIVGVTSCKIFDRFYLKRCALCQKFGHYFAHCKTKDNPNCAHCSGEHETNHCKSTDEADKKCINCIRSDFSDCNHHAFSKLCPVYIGELEKLKQLAEVPLN